MEADALRNGLLVLAGVTGLVDGVGGDHIELVPPYVVDDDHISFIVSTLRDSIVTVTLGGGPGLAPGSERGVTMPKEYSTRLRRRMRGGPVCTAWAACSGDAQVDADGGPGVPTVPVSAVERGARVYEAQLRRMSRRGR